MSFLKNRKIAALIMFCLIAISICFGSYRSLNSLYNNTVSAFYEDESKNLRSIQSNLDERTNISYNMISIAKKYYSSSEKFIKDASEAKDSLANASTPSQKYNANKILTTSADELYYKLINTKVVNTDTNKLNDLYGQFNDCNESINHSKYNQYAQEFNNTIGAFPTNIIASAGKFSPIELYI